MIFISLFVFGFDHARESFLPSHVLQCFVLFTPLSQLKFSDSESFVPVEDMYKEFDFGHSKAQVV
jgi:hypothetical protein